MTWQVGDKVRISSHHWARPRATGTIAEINMERGTEHAYLVHFDSEGIGIEGRDMWVDPAYFIK